jgi:hypothetical protein
VMIPPRDSSFTSLGIQLHITADELRMLHESVALIDLFVRRHVLGDIDPERWDPRIPLRSTTAALRKAIERAEDETPPVMGRR